MAQPDSTDTAQPIGRGGKAAGGAERLDEDPSRSVAAASAADSLLTEAGLGLFDRRNPRYLLNLFSVLSVLSVAVILLLVGYGVYRVYSSEMIKGAENDAVAVAQAIFGQEQRVLAVRDPDGGERIRVAREEFAGLDERMRKYLHPFDMYKIKVFSRDKTIVYSTDHSIIGKVDSDNVRLDRVLRSGAVDSRLQSKDKVADLAGEERFNVDVVETYLPIRAGDAIIGSFEVYIDVSRARNRIATVLASSIAILFVVLVVVFAGLYVPMWRGTLWLEQAQDELHVLATTDSLTRIFNRRHLLDRIREESTRMSREAGVRSLPHVAGFLMVDIDHFKRINDEHGHPVGDVVLREISSRLKRALRTYDVIGRYGGEEFLVMLPRTDFENAKKIAERMCAIVHATPVRVDGKSIRATVSIGIATSDGSAEDMVDAAIRRADMGMYKAKNAGRDRVAWA
ncbi:MAG: GGDEF domain-containing protein [Betaproteobacteria bacterium]|nr:GGDEF domain-containing protein [Betaproteobacteria bacterium]